MACHCLQGSWFRAFAGGSPAPLLPEARPALTMRLALRRRSCRRRSSPRWRVLKAVGREPPRGVRDLFLAQDERGAEGEREVILLGDGLEFDREPHRLVQAR